MLKYMSESVFECVVFTSLLWFPTDPESHTSAQHHQGQETHWSLAVNKHRNKPHKWQEFCTFGHIKVSNICPNLVSLNINSSLFILKPATTKYLSFDYIFATGLIPGLILFFQIETPKRLGIWPSEVPRTEGDAVLFISSNQQSKTNYIYNYTKQKSSKSSFLNSCTAFVLDWQKKIDHQWLW